MPDWKKLLIEWNSRFPLDREFRKKNNIVFNSEEHRKINQLDLYLQSLEDSLYAEFIKKAKRSLENEQLVKKGVYFREDLTTDDDSDLFDKIKIGDMQSSNIKFEE